MRFNQTIVLCVLCLCVQALQACLIISEVNCDNPSLDTKEFVELYYLGGSSISLDGYTLVFYNGNGNRAYRVVDLSEHHTDERGFFLVGSAELLPQPAVSLPPNSIQNGPDAIALYGPSWDPVAEGGNVSAVGLLDAIVYTSRKAPGNADFLAWVLTPGFKPYLEDEQALVGDESIQRCWLSDNLYTFQNGSPTAGLPNDCSLPSFNSLRINMIQLGGEKPAGPLELSVDREMGPLTVVVYDTQKDTVSASMEFRTSKVGPAAVNIDTTALSKLDDWALAIYDGQVTDFPKDSPLSQLQPLDAFVYGGRTRTPSTNLTETLIPGRKPFKLDSGFPEGDAYIMRCGVAHWTRDPGVFQLLAQKNSGLCTWYTTCPYNTAVNSTEEPFQPPSRNDTDFLISEVNADSPGAAEDEEFIELWHPFGRRMSLDNIWLLLFNGNNGKVYKEIELHGYYTDKHGYFLIGSDKVSPDLALPANTIQNGPDAIAIYRSSSPPSSEGTNIPKSGLLDAVVYRARGSDKDSPDLIQALTPAQLPLLEDSTALPDDESLSRCGLDKLSLNSFRVASPTPKKKNDCPHPHPPEGLLINEVGGVSGAGSSLFVELIGPPSHDLQGLNLVLLGKEGARHDVLLSGSIRENGFYLLKNESGADHLLPEVSSIGAVLLCIELFGEVSMCGSNSQVQDLLIFSDDQRLRHNLHGGTQQHVHPVPSFDSLSRCSTNGSAVWISSNLPTPLQQNRCPSSAYSNHIELCLQPEHKQFDCNEEGFATLLEQSCHCGISSLHLKGVNLTCVSEKLYIEGSVLALSEQQREHVVQTLQSKQLPSCSTIHERIYSKDSSVGLQVGLVLMVVFLFALGGAIFFYLYKKRHPQDYYSMELNEHESPIEL
ncbi:hypothetical protein AMEX_G8490 [Astyanax mexicanus]|uniref:LTD domain-containing protein n=1 Tax=Astyanax mexicanus TaxID=7994 RepID=A0A8T2LWW4_ASTMX|nr:hypothetical protein AMEX_G8490 [Astyanax mexicanus]